MKLKQLINEEWAASIQGGDITYEIFKNPSRKEIVDILKASTSGYDDIRFMIDGNKKNFYVWDADLLHQDAAEALGFQRYYRFYEDDDAGEEGYIWGMAKGVKKANPVFTLDATDTAGVERYKKAGFKTGWFRKYFKINKVLQEEWATTTKKDGQTFEIFKNPTVKEIKETGREEQGGIYLRFIIDAINKNLYVFDSELFHMYAAKELGIGGKYAEDSPHGSNGYLFGVSSVNKGKLNFLSVRNPAQRLFKKYDADWLSKWFDSKGLNEEWEKTVKVSNQTFEIFKNPTKKEIQEVSKGTKSGNIRFFAVHSTKTVYIWGAGLLHDIAFKRLAEKGIFRKTDTNIHDNESILAGEGKFKNGGGTFLHSFNAEFGRGRETLQKKDWSWVDKYFAGTSASIEGLKDQKLYGEEWAASTGKGDGIIEFFVNPSQKEMMEISKAGLRDGVIRFLAHHPSKKVYIFTSRIIHSTAVYKLVAENVFPRGSDYYTGIVFAGGTYNPKTKKILYADKTDIDDDEDMSEWGTEELKEIGGTLNKNWSFVNKYIPGFNENIIKNKKRFEAKTKKKKISEGWEASVKKKTRHTGPKVNIFDIFKNPSKKEIQESSKRSGSIRYMLDGHKKEVYVWDPNLLHGEAAKELGMSDNYNSFIYDAKRGYVWGLGDVKNGKITIVSDSEYTENNVAEMAFDIFVKKYGTDWFKRWFIIPVNEEWAASTKKGKDTYEIFKNPTAKEVNEVGGTKRFEVSTGKVSTTPGRVRFLIDMNKKNLYVWKPDLLHASAAIELGTKYSYTQYDNIERGYYYEVAAIKNGKLNINFLYIDELLTELKKKNLTTWLKRYLTPESKAQLDKEIKDLKEEWEDTITIKSPYNKNIAIEIFRNPSRKEFNDVAKKIHNNLYVRFIARKGKVYVFRPDVLHVDVAEEKFKFKYSDVKTDGDYWGTAKSEGGQWNFDGSDEHTKLPPKYIEKYIKVDRKYNIVKGSKLSPDDFNEEFVDEINNFAVYKNPSSSEARKVESEGQNPKLKEIRWLANAKTKDVYIFSDRILHWQIANKFLKMRPADYKAQTYLLGGIAHRELSTWVTGDRDMHNYEHSSNQKKNKFKQNNWKFVEKYHIKLPPKIFAPIKKMNEGWEAKVTINRRFAKTSEPMRVDVFVNPTGLEMFKASEGGEIRYIANFADKRVFVFTPEVTHMEMAKKIGLSRSMADYWNNSNLLGGVAKLESGKFKTKDVHNLKDLAVTDLVDKSVRFEIAKKNWKFVDKYIKTSSFVEDKRERMEGEYKILKAKKRIREQYEL